MGQGAKGIAQRAKRIDECDRNVVARFIGRRANSKKQAASSRKQVTRNKESQRGNGKNVVVELARQNLIKPTKVGHYKRKT
jgi:hypothetical protein